MKKGATIVIALLLCSAVFAQEKKSAAKSAGAAKPAAAHHSMTKQADLKWSALAPGFEMAVVSGDPAKPGPYVLRIRATSENALVPPHWHPTDENITVLSGWFKLGEGDNAEEKSAHELQTGDFMLLPAKVHHFGYQNKGGVIQVHGAGPFVVNWVKPPAAAMKK